jgi:very-short-patch-repair endonuclease
LIIELDGEYHDKIRREDENREEFLKKHGFRVLRFTNDHVLSRIEWTLQTIACELAIDWHKNYHDYIGNVKYPQRLYNLLAGIKKYREK